MARKENPGRDADRRRWHSGLRYALSSLTVLTLIVLALFLYGRTDQYLAENPRFHLAGPSEETGESPAVRIEGAPHIPRARVLGAFSADFGRSVYLLPLAERRRSLLAIDWVKDVSVSRLWPDRLAVTIVERRPVAFVQLPATGARPRHEIALIDADGVILVAPERTEFSLPVLIGIRREQDQDARRRRVSVALRLVRELGEEAGKLSEIDVSDPDNIRVVEPAEGHAFLLLLGDRNFLSRLQNFHTHYPEIQRWRPNAVDFDLSVDDRITALGESGRGK